MMFHADMENSDIAFEAVSRLRDAADADGRPLAAISRAGGLSDSHLNYVYNRRKYPNLTTFIRICLALGLSPNEVLNWGNDGDE